MSRDQDGIRPGFWRHHRIDRLRPTEWEALCDGCGLCCLVKLEDEDTARVHLTSVSCRLLDTETCRCGNYPLRQSLVKGCLVLTPASLKAAMAWLPGTCAYKLVAQGRDLPEWHHLVCGNPEAVHRAGISRRGRMVPEYEVDEDEIEDYVIEEE